VDEFRQAVAEADRVTSICKLFAKGRPRQVAPADWSAAERKCVLEGVTLGEAERVADSLCSPKAEPEPADGQEE
jgi:hypothetical protein